MIADIYEAPPKPHTARHLDEVAEKLGELEAAIDAAFRIDYQAIVDCVVARDAGLADEKESSACQAAIRDSGTAKVKFTLAVRR